MFVGLIRRKGSKLLFKALAIFGIRQGRVALSFLIFLCNVLQVSLKLVVEVGQILESSNYNLGQSHSKGWILY